MCGYFFKERFLIRCLCKISKTYRPHKNTLWDHINGRIHHSHLSENPFRDRISQNSRIGTDGGILQHFLFAVSIVIIKKHSKNRASCLYYDPRNSNSTLFICKTSTYLYQFVYILFRLYLSFCIKSAKAWELCSCTQFFLNTKQLIVLGNSLASAWSTGLDLAGI